MNFGEAITTCFFKYATFSGRAQRSEFWYFTLFIVLGSVFLGLVDRIAFGYSAVGSGTLGAFFELATLVPSLAVAVRRLHDLGQSGWWWLLWFVPVIGWAFLLYWYTRVGTSGDNEYGPDPLGDDEYADLQKSSIPSVARDD